jgi:hypothetical protein
VATTYADLHGLVDRLTPEQADAVRGVVQQLVAVPAGHADVPIDEVDADGRVRRLSFAGTLRTGKGDLAARSEDIIRAAATFDGPGPRQDATVPDATGLRARCQVISSFR